LCQQPLLTELLQLEQKVVTLLQVQVVLAHQCAEIFNLLKVQPSRYWLANLAQMTTLLVLVAVAEELL
jgi:hypothetical protein